MGQNRKKESIFRLDGRRYFLWYTVLFFLCCLGVYAPFYLLGRSFIWQTDGWMQHYRALLYYAGWLRSIGRDLWETHRLSIPNYSFALGDGADVVEALHYYVIGDPFAFFSVFFSEKQMPFYYAFMILLRLYLAGVAFSCFCFQTKKSGCAVLAGSLAYVFCGYALFAAVRHPYFALPFLYLPLLLMGVERILQKKGGLFLTLAVFLSAVSNFYFFYMLAVLTALYTIMRLAAGMRGQPAQAFRMLGRIAVASLSGVLLSGFLLAPVLYAFLADSRMAVSYEIPFFYPLEHYCRIFSLFLSRGGSYWAYLGYCVPCLPAVFLLFFKKKSNGLLKGLFVAGLVLLAFPIFGHILNGFSYFSNRWCFGFSMVAAYILTAMWDDLMRADRRECLALAAASGVYFALCVFLEKSRGTQPYFEIALLFVFLFLLLWQAERQQADRIWIARLSLALLVANVIANGYWLNAPTTGNYASDFIETEDVALKLQANTGAAVEAVADRDGAVEFYRYSGRSLTKNAALLGGPYSTQYYWSLSNSAVNAFRTDMNLLEYREYDYMGFDDRTALNTLDSVRYYAVPAGSTRCIPYGFSYVETINLREEETEEAERTLQEELGTEELTEDQLAVVEAATRSRYAVYRNDYALPLGYVYHGYLPEKDWRELSLLQRQETLLQQAVLEETPRLTQPSAPELTSVSLPFEIRCDSRDVSWEEGAFVTTAENVSVTLSFVGLPDSETYVNLEGLSFSGTPAYELYFGEDRVDPKSLYNRTNWELLSSENREQIKRDALYWKEPESAGIGVRASTGASKTLTYHTQSYSWFNDRHDFAVNLGYSQDAVTEITLTFPERGIYSYAVLEVLCQPMEQYAGQISRLQEETLQNVEIGQDVVTGEAALNSPGLLCLTIPYAKGWTAFVDGRQTKLYRVNERHMGLEMDAGAHTIRLEYETPFWREGLLLSLGGLALVLACRFIELGFVKFRKTP